MSEKLCLKWNDFQENVNIAFGSLREDTEFVDVTLACEDGQQVEAHKVILAASSPFFETILQRNKHPHPLIYLGGFKSEDLMAILDFLYFGEAKVYQENLDSFLAIAEEVKLRGLTGQTISEVVEEEEKPKNPKRANQTKESLYRDNDTNAPLANDNVAEKVFKALAIPDQFIDLQALDEKVKSMMEKSKNMIPSGRQADGTPKQERAFICKVCGKESMKANLIGHIEASHLVGLSFPCEFCDKSFSSRQSMRSHKRICAK